MSGNYVCQTKAPVLTCCAESCRLLFELCYDRVGIGSFGPFAASAKNEKDSLGHATSLRMSLQWWRMLQPAVYTVQLQTHVPRPTVWNKQSALMRHFFLVTKQQQLNKQLNTGQINNSGDFLRYLLLAESHLFGLCHPSKRCRSAVVQCLWRIESWMEFATGRWAFDVQSFKGEHACDLCSYEHRQWPDCWKMFFPVQTAHIVACIKRHLRIMSTKAIQYGASKMCSKRSAPAHRIQQEAYKCREFLPGKEEVNQERLFWLCAWGV